MLLVVYSGYVCRYRCFLADSASTCERLTLLRTSRSPGRCGAFWHFRASSGMLAFVFVCGHPALVVWAPSIMPLRQSQQCSMSGRYHSSAPEQESPGSARLEAATICYQGNGTTSTADAVRIAMVL
jgi:hypothetical protein